MQTLQVSPKGWRWYLTGHPWIYRSDLAKAFSEGKGEVVQVSGPSGQLLGQYFYNPASKIALRLIRREDAPIDRNFWSLRLAQAIAYRKQIVEDSNAYRLISSEADGFPGLIVDRYNDVLVLQSLCLGMDKILPQMVELLCEQLQPRCIVARNDVSMRSLEGLPQETSILFGKEPGEVAIELRDYHFKVDVLQGQKTGWYLDQRENYQAAGQYSRGKVLDVCAYQGGFACHVAKGAERVLALDSSEAALKRLKENVELNHLTNVETICENAFDALKTFDHEKRKFDFIILDPPAFAKSKVELAGAIRGYKDLNLRALKCLNPGGHLMTFSCSYNMDEVTFIEVLRDAAADARRTVRWIEMRTQAKDHPILLTLPESKYLKCAILQIADL